MTTYMVSFSFEADSQEEAESIVGTWEVTPGVTVLSVVGQATPRPPYELKYGGPVAPAFLTPPPTPPPAPLPPPVQLTSKEE